MRVRTSLVPAVCLSLLILTGCCYPLVPVETDLTDDDDGATDDLVVGESITVGLTSNPTTGYSWSVAGIDEDVLSLSGEEYIPECTGLVGSGGIAVFEFTATGAGSTMVELIEHRPWEVDSTISTFTFTVNVTAE